MNYKVYYVFYLFKLFLKQLFKTTLISCATLYVGWWNTPSSSCLTSLRGDGKNRVGYSWGIAHGVCFFKITTTTTKKQLSGFPLAGRYILSEENEIKSGPEIYLGSHYRAEQCEGEQGPAECPQTAPGGGEVPLERIEEMRKEEKFWLIVESHKKLFNSHWNTHRRLAWVPLHCSCVLCTALPRCLIGDVLQ